ncbi:hypothetical protein [Saccharopolyspora sp. NPDC050642]|uniref:hypothetical protein n=1 Tax=Saccharopolyspora sp. NPDC050642 TaxID=3157099 RepID=UPI0033CF8A47
MVEQTDPVHHDVLLEAVLRLKQAGETSPGRISDLLQLPDDLVRHLLAQAGTERLRVSTTGKITTNRTAVAWIYRDVATDELWPEPGAELRPIPLRFTARHRAVFEHGTAGRPVEVDCRLLSPDLHEPAEPSPLELARFSRATNDPNRRTALVSSGEPCLIAGQLAVTSAGVAVMTTRGTPHASLTRYLSKTAEKHEPVARWLRSVPSSIDNPGPVVPLRAAVDDLLEVLAEYQYGEAGLVVMSRIELALRRYCDQCWYLAGTDPASTPVWSTRAADELAIHLGLDQDATQQLVTTVPDSLPALAGRLAAFKLSSSTSTTERAALSTLVELTIRWASLSTDPAQPRQLETLADKAITLCNQLMEPGGN